MKFHPAANIFPLLEDAEQNHLVEDLRKHGLLEDIETLDGQILDGRNRYRCCLLAQIAPRFREVRVDDPVAYVISKNLHRRHLTPTQISMVGARAREHYDREAKERQKRKPADSVQENLPEQKGQARDQAAKAVGVSGRTIDFATKVLAQGTPELIQAVDQGRVAVSHAAVLASEPPERQKEVLASGRHNRRYRPTRGGGPTGEHAPPAAAWKTQTVTRGQLEKLAALADELDRLTDRPSANVPIPLVRKALRDLRGRLSALLS